MFQPLSRWAWCKKLDCSGACGNQWASDNFENSCLWAREPYPLLVPLHVPHDEFNIFVVFHLIVSFSYTLGTQSNAQHLTITSTLCETPAREIIRHSPITFSGSTHTAFELHLFCLPPGCTSFRRSDHVGLGLPDQQSTLDLHFGSCSGGSVCPRLDR